MIHRLAQVTFDRFAEAARTIAPQQDESYLISYREFLNYFADLPEINIHHFVIGAHFTYGWMPRILTIKRPVQDYPIAVTILNKARQKQQITEYQLVTLSKFINNSIVGASKLLHFVNPEVYAIWDSRICTFICGRDITQHGVDGARQYFSYLENGREIMEHPGFPPLYESICDKMGQRVLPLRAIEWVMYMQG